MFTEITADDITQELSCLDLNFLIKFKSQHTIIPNRKCPLNIIQWQKMKNNKWILHFSDMYIKYNYSKCATCMKYHNYSKNTIIIYKEKKTYIKIYR